MTMNARLNESFEVNPCLAASIALCSMFSSTFILFANAKSKEITRFRFGV
jgi:hypothetical protein